MYLVELDLVPLPCRCLYKLNVFALKTNAIATKTPCNEVRITKKYQNTVVDVTTTARRPNNHVNPMRVDNFMNIETRDSTVSLASLPCPGCFFENTLQ